MIEALLQKVPASAPAEQYESQPKIAIYSLEPNSEEILTRVSNRFNIKLLDYSHRIEFVHVSGKWMLLPKAKLTMVMHIVLPMIYCIKCLFKYQPDIFYDTTGFAFNFLAVKLLLPSTECRAYVHYPFISEDMVQKIRDRRTDFNNDSSVAQSTWKTNLKLAYYSVILSLYKVVRFTVSKAQANSTWTYNHMIKLWGNNIVKLYPPCSIADLIAEEKIFRPEIKIISLAQFRPEKNHMLQIQVINKLVQRLRNQGNNNQITLYVCGTTRGEDDEKLLQSLKQKVSLLKLETHIQFCVNMKWTDLLSKIKECNYGIHSMQAEHFGISIVEMVSAGVLVVAHNSAGPRYDIIKDQRLLAENQQEYEDKLYTLIKMSENEKKSLVQELRSRMHEFGENSFKQNFRSIFFGKKTV